MRTTPIAAIAKDFTIKQIRFTRVEATTVETPSVAVNITESAFQLFVHVDVLVSVCICIDLVFV